MNKILIFSLLIFGCSILFTSKTSKYSAFENIRPWIQSEIINITSLINQSTKQLHNKKALVNFYKQFRYHYKRIEFFIEYCSPREAKLFINGPLVSKHEPEIRPLVFPPAGFQKIEELLFTSDVLDTAQLLSEYKNLKIKLDDLNKYYTTLKLPDELLLEMFQIELFRTAALGLNGYDATITRENILEAGYVLEGIEKAVQYFNPYLINNRDQKVLKKFRNKINKSVALLQINPSFEHFDRLDFITNHLIELHAGITELHFACNLPWDKRKQAIIVKNKNPFIKESFNLRYFSMYYDDSLNLEKQAKLGRLLFFDHALSANNKRSCATCHHPEKAFTDGLKKSTPILENEIIDRNAPTLIDVALQKAFFHDGRTYYLEQQAEDVIHNKAEMGSTLSQISEILKQSEEYKLLFRQAFSMTDDSSITPYAIQKALTEYEKTLVSLNSPFDKYLKGNKQALSSREINGYNLFAGKALCGSCHFFPLFNGTVPPFYNESEFEVLGVPGSSANEKLDKDQGRKKITNIQQHNHAFKTPGIRNVSLTGPYMHNGVYETLEEVIDFYHIGGGQGLGFNIPEQTLPFDSLLLSNSEKEDIILFMKALTDTSGLTGKPAYLPGFGKISGSERRSVINDY